LVKGNPLDDITVLLDKKISRRYSKKGNNEKIGGSFPKALHIVPRPLYLREE
jgi:hypothetical protein